MANNSLCFEGGPETLGTLCNVQQPFRCDGAKDPKARAAKASEIDRNRNGGWQSN